MRGEGLRGLHGSSASEKHISGVIHVSDMSLHHNELAHRGVHLDSLPHTPSCCTAECESELKCIPRCNSFYFLLLQKSSGLQSHGQRRLQHLSGSRKMQNNTRAELHGVSARQQKNAAVA